MNPLLRHPRLLRWMPGLALPWALLMFAPWATAEQGRRVDVVVAGDAAVAGRVMSVLRASLARQGLDVVSKIVPRIDPAELGRAASDLRALRDVEVPLTRLWLDLVAPQPAIYFLATRDAQIYVRPLDVSASPDTVEIELIRFVVDASVHAIVNGHAPTGSRKQFETSAVVAPAPPTAPPRRPPVAIVPRPTWTMDVGYAASMLSATQVAHGPELSADLHWRHLQLGASFSQQLPLTIDGPAARLQLVSTSARLVAAIPIAIGPRLLASLGGGAGIDVTHVATESAGATTPFWVSDSLLRGIVTLRRAFGDVAAALDVGADLDLVTARYTVIRSSGQATVLWRPWRARPFVSLRIGYTF